MNNDALAPAHGRTGRTPTTSVRHLNSASRFGGGLQGAFASPAKLQVRLLGRFAASWRGRAIPLGSRNSAGLLALLVLRRWPHTRRAIATELWPDTSSGSSGSLRQALWLLKHGLAAAGAVPNELLLVDEETIALRPGIAADIDVARFEALLRHRPAGLEEALDLYRGDLLEGVDLECFAAERERLADQYEDALADIATLWLRRGAVGAASEAALRLLRRDPLREEAHAVLIAGYGIAGTRSQVHRQYRRLRAILEQELGVEPLAETEAAYRAALEWSGSRSGASIVHSLGHSDTSLAGTPGVRGSPARQ
jgi:DNA-binding SARP family transcriptional activator